MVALPLEYVRKHARMPIYRARNRQFFAFPPFSPPASHMTIKSEECFRGNHHGRSARVRVRVRVRLGLGLEGNELGYESISLLLFYFCLFIIIYFSYRKIRKVLTGVLALMLASLPGAIFRDLKENLSKIIGIDGFALSCRKPKMSCTQNCVIDRARDK